MTLYHSGHLNQVCSYIFGIYKLKNSIPTLLTAITVAPTGFGATAAGTSVTFFWSGPDVSEVIVSYRITCDSEIDIEVKNINTITLYDLPPETNLSCAIAGASSGGYGPYSSAISVVTEGQLPCSVFFFVSE